MKKPRLLLVSLACSTTVVAAWARSSTSAASPPQQQTQTPPDAPLDGLPKREVLLQVDGPQEVHGEVSFSIEDREVRIRWVYRGTTNQPLLSFQYEPVRFWPTEVASYGTNTLLVAGKDSRDGAAVIEKWTFAPPSPFPTAMADPVTGEIIEPMIRFDVVSRTLIRRVSGQGPVFRLFRLRGVSDQAIVQFWDTRDLQVMDLTDGSLTTLIAAAPQGSLPVQPELSNNIGTRWTADHVDEGYVYYLGVLDGDQHLVAFDTDRDGTLDVDSILTWNDYWSLELDQALKYSAFY